MQPKFLSISNFKSIGDRPQRIELAPITLLFGPNSAGKSTLIQALIYLNEILVNRNYNPDRTSVGGDWLDLGGFRNLVHDHDIAEPIKIGIGFDAAGVELPAYISDSERERLDQAQIEMPETWFDGVNEFSIDLTLRWSETLGRPFVESYESGIDGERIALITSSEDGRQVFLEQINLSHPAFGQGVSVEASPDSTGDSEGIDVPDLIRMMLPDAATHAIDKLFQGDRPFASSDLDELETMLNREVKGQQGLLQKIADELAMRTSRRASTMSKQAQAAIQQSVDVTVEIGAIGLIEQSDALPLLQEGLKIEGPVLHEDTESELADLDLLFLLCESLLSGFIAGPQQVISQWLDEFRYIGPLRDLPPRNLQPHLTPDNARWAKGLAAWELLHHANKSQVDEINFWLGEQCLKTGYQVFVHRYRELPQEAPIMTFLEQEMDLDQQLVLHAQLAELPLKTRVTLVEDATGLEVMPQDIGVGISQLFPVIVLTVIQDKGLIAIEQPELHVHPAIQVELADLFSRYALEHDKFMILETHSEHVMLRLLRRIRELGEQRGMGEQAPPYQLRALLKPVDMFFDSKLQARPPEQQAIDFDKKTDRLTRDSLSVQYVESGPDGTTFKRLRVDDSGDFLDEWPNGFFEERDEELFF